MVNGRPGVAPQTAKREEFTRLIAEGLWIAEAVRRVGIHYRTGRRWVRGRTVRLPSGAARHYPPVIIVKGAGVGAVLVRGRAHHDRRPASAGTHHPRHRDTAGSSAVHGQPGAAAQPGTRGRLPA